MAVRISTLLWGGENYFFGDLLFLSRTTSAYIVFLARNIWGCWVLSISFLILLSSSSYIVLKNVDEGYLVILDCLATSCLILLLLSSLFCFWMFTIWEYRREWALISSASYFIYFIFFLMACSFSSYSVASIIFHFYSIC